MRSSEGIAGLFLLGFIIAWWAFSIGMTVYGVYLAFTASVVVGICFLFVPFMFPLSALLSMFAHLNLPVKILELFS